MRRTSTFLSTTIAAAFAASIFSIPVYAAGGGTPTTQTPSCKRGKIWDRKRKRCVRVRKRSGLSDDNIFGAARTLAYEKRYDEALDVLNLAENQNDPRILNYKGFANRKLGRIEEGLVYYRTALKADPNYTLVREYMGEAFLQLGQVDKAREQLAELERICGVDCREYAMLKKQIDAVE